MARKLSQEEIVTLKTLNEKGQSNVEIGRTLGVTEGAVRYHLRRAVAGVADGRRTPYRSRSFDRVLVDAPCSGLGTLRRRPEVRFRVEAADLANFAARQEQMLEEALRVVKSTMPIPFPLP